MKNKTDSKQNLTSDEQLFEVSKQIREHAETILRVWAERVRAEVSTAEDLQEPVLYNSMPQFLDKLADTLDPNHPKRVVADDTSIAEEHGSERARMTKFGPDQLIREYQILRMTIFDELRITDLKPGVRNLIYTSMDNALREAMTAYTLVHSNIREQFIATLTHDLRNPLGAAKLAAELILMDPKDNEVPLLAAKAIENLKRVDRMIQDLLDTTYAKGGGRIPLQITEFDIIHLVEDALKGLKLEYGNRFIIQGVPIRVHWSYDNVLRAFVNLVVNALKYGEPRSPITVEARPDHGNVVLSVHNEGKPIPIEEQELIFQPFRRSHQAEKGKKQGWGLGLALVKGVAEAHGGSIIVQSSFENGTTFMLVVPRDARPFQDKPTTV